MGGWDPALLASSVCSWHYGEPPSVEEGLGDGDSEGGGVQVAAGVHKLATDVVEGSAGVVEGSASIMEQKDGAGLAVRAPGRGQDGGVGVAEQRRRRRAGAREREDETLRKFQNARALYRTPHHCRFLLHAGSDIHHHCRIEP